MPVCPHIETSELIYCANQLIGFYIKTTLAFNGLIHRWRDSKAAGLHSAALLENGLNLQLFFEKFKNSIAGIFL